MDTSRFTAYINMEVLLHNEILFHALGVMSSRGLPFALSYSSRGPTLGVVM